MSSTMHDKYSLRIELDTQISASDQNDARQKAEKYFKNKEWQKSETSRSIQDDELNVRNVKVTVSPT